MEKIKILPGKAVDNLKIGVSKKEMLDLLGTPKLVKQLLSGCEINSYDNYKIWIENDKITQISVFGCEAYVNNDVKIGSLKNALNEKYPLIYDEDGYWYSNKIPGILFEFENGILSKIYVTGQ